MAREVRAFQVTIPAGTALATPFQQLITFPVRKVDTLEIIVPPGPSGLMGFAITMGGVNVIPIVPNTFIITDDERISWPLTNLPDSGAWQLTGYNTDVWDHSVYLRWLVDVVDAPVNPGALTGADMTALSNF